MARLARVIAPGNPHHITQRASGKRFILETDADRGVYLDLLRQNTELHGVQVIGFCLMSNHVHIVAAPRKATSLALALKNTHGRFASYLERGESLLRSFVAKPILLLRLG